MSDATVVVVHGLAIMQDARNMMTGVVEALQARGFHATRTVNSGDGTLEELADRLWQQLARIDGPLVLLCHSMGGIQSRTFLLDDARARRIRAIATLGSPHQGTPLARFAAPFQRACRYLTPTARARWNEAYGAQEQTTAARHGVRCVSAVATLQDSARHARLLIPQQLLQRLAGPNDGLVPAASQRWGEHAFDVDLDHIECAAKSNPPPRARSSVDTWVRLAEIALSEPVRRIS